MGHTILPRMPVKIVTLNENSGVKNISDAVKYYKNNELPSWTEYYGFSTGIMDAHKMDFYLISGLKDKELAKGKEIVQCLRPETFTGNVISVDPLVPNFTSEIKNIENFIKNNSNEIIFSVGPYYNNLGVLKKSLIEDSEGFLVYHKLVTQNNGVLKFNVDSSVISFHDYHKKVKYFKLENGF